MTLREDARRILDAALAAAGARAAVLRALRREGDALTVADGETVDLGAIDRVWIVGAGKAAVPMAAAALEVLGDRVAGGTVTTKDGHGGALPGIEVWEAAHPLPDARGLAGAAAALEVARGAGASDLVLVLLSGGASALWPAPPPGVLLSDVRAVTDRLLRAGATIHELNAVRKRLSRVAGGGLAKAAHPARVVALAVSDVVGSPLGVIASGPTVADTAGYAEALEVLLEYGITGPNSVTRWLQAGAAGEAPPPFDARDPAFARTASYVIARNRDALSGAAAEAERLGYAATLAGDDLEGEAREVAREVARLGLEALEGGDPRPTAILLGGETTVTVRGTGRGGRNQEMALALALEIEGRDGIVAAALGTDGTDGTTDAAGAMVDGGTVARGDAAGLDARAALDRNDAHPFLQATGDLIVTGPTGTNVNDVVLLLVRPPR